MNTQRIAALVLTLLGGASATWAAPGVVLVQRVTSNGTARTSQVYMTADRMRAEVDLPNAPRQIVVFDGVAQVMFVVDSERKAYVEMTKADVDRMAARMPEMMAKMQKMLEGMPPEQRAKLEAQIEQMTGSRSMPGSSGAMKVEYRKGGTDRVGSWTCDVYEMMTNGRKIGDLCTVRPEALGLTVADFEISRRMQTFFQALSPQGANGLFQVGTPGDQGFDGVPVRHSMNVLGPMLSELQSASRQNVADDLFAPPKGFQKTTMPARPGGPGQPPGR